MKAFVIDVDRCNGCHSCQIACKDEHCDQAWPPYTAAEPQTGQFWMRIQQKERGQVPLTKVSYTPVLCQHCQDAPCEKVAPAGTFERREDGILILKPNELTPEQCQQIADACPIGAIFVNEEQKIDQKCAGCAHLLDNGWKVPRCVDVCPTDAIRFGDVEEFADILPQTEVIDPALADAKPIVHYLNLPKRFVGGVVIDSKEDEVVIGADVVARDGDKVVMTGKTDDFGDWLFEQLEPGTYTIDVAASGMNEKSFTVDLTEKDLYAGVTDLA